MASSSTRSSKPSSKNAAERKPRLLPPAFYSRETHRVARALLGKVVVVKTPEGTASGRILETEAYWGDDPASHSCRGETPRAAIMFGEPGKAYVYFIYGMYEMLNFVTEKRGRAGAVLIRALEPLTGLELMHERRPAARRDADLTSGPGKLCRALGIELRHNGASLAGPELMVYDDGFGSLSVHVSPRVGITQARDVPARYFIGGHPGVSKASENKLAVAYISRRGGTSRPERKHAREGLK